MSSLTLFSRKRPLLFLAGSVGAITDDSFAGAWAEFEALRVRRRPGARLIEAGTASSQAMAVRNM